MWCFVTLVLAILSLICLSDGRVRLYQNNPLFDRNTNLTVTHTTVISVDGTSYVMQLGKELSLQEAELFCQREFPKRMHLLSIESEKEWLQVCKSFGNDTATNIWLGSEIKRQHKSSQLNIHWIDNSPFSYHRVPLKELKGVLKPDEIGCLIGTLLSTGNGNWTIQRAPCDKSHAFICKSVQQHNTANAQYSDPLDSIFKFLNYDPLTARLTKFWSSQFIQKSHKTSPTTVASTNIIKPVLQEDTSVSEEIVYTSLKPVVENSEISSVTTNKIAITTDKASKSNINEYLAITKKLGNKELDVQQVNSDEHLVSPNEKEINKTQEFVTGSIAEEAPKAVAAQVILPPAEWKKSQQSLENEKIISNDIVSETLAPHFLKDFFGFDESVDVPVL